MSSSTTQREYLLAITSSILDFANELVAVASEEDIATEYPKGTIVKALDSDHQSRFKPTSVWVSLGDGTFKHLNGEKGLITTADRLRDYTSIVYLP